MDEVTLRDYFAAKAMQALLGTSPITYEREKDDSGAQINYLVEESYRLADAMLNERDLGKN